ncbi:MAG: hypothetical protein M1839_006429 [Geoglossum umbratile]|nr:MAG: hypothetical protein M1839_006429 [Geoglossum umbratile]
MSSGSQNARFGPPQPCRTRGNSRSYQLEPPEARGRHPAAGQWSTANLDFENPPRLDAWLDMVESPADMELGGSSPGNVGPVQKPTRPQLPQYCMSAPTDAPTTPAGDGEGAPGGGATGSESNSQSPTRTRSNGGGSPEGSQDTRTQYACDHPGCSGTLGRPQDISRHKSSVHSMGRRYPCPLVGDHGCSREDGFPRKDKLMDHLRQKHKVPDPKHPRPQQGDASPSESDQDQPTSAHESHPLELLSSSDGALSQVTGNRRVYPNARAGRSAQGSHHTIPMSTQAIVSTSLPSRDIPSLQFPMRSPRNRLDRTTGDNDHDSRPYPQVGCGQTSYHPGTPACVDGFGTRYAGTFAPENLNNSASRVILSNLQCQPDPQVVDTLWAFGQASFRQEKAKPILYRRQTQGAPTAGIPTTAQHAGLVEHGESQHSTEYVSTGQYYWPSYGTSAVSPFSSPHQYQHPQGPSSSQRATPDAPSTIQLLPSVKTALDSVYRRQSEKGYKQDQSYR